MTQIPVGDPLLPLTEALREVIPPPNLLSDLLETLDKEPEVPYRQSSKTIGFIVGTLSMGAAVAAVAVIGWLGMKPRLAWSQVLQANTKTFNLIAETEGTGFSSREVISGAKFAYSIANGTKGRVPYQEIDWSFDGRRLFSSYLFQMRGQAGRYRGVLSDGRRWGTVKTGSRFTPGDISGFMRAQGNFAELARQPNFFPFKSPTLLSGRQSFRGSNCLVFIAKEPLSNHGELVQGRVLVDEESHRILRRILTRRDGSTFTTTFSYPPAIDSREFVPDRRIRVFDLDQIRDKLRQAERTPVVARTQSGRPVDLVAAVADVNGDLLVFWKGVPPNGDLRQAASIIANPTKVAYGLAGLTTSRYLQNPHLDEGSVLAGHSIHPKFPVGPLVDLKVPHFERDLSSPLRDARGRVVGYRSKCDGFAVFRHVKVWQAPDVYSLLLLGDARQVTASKPTLAKKSAKF